MEHDNRFPLTDIVQSVIVQNHNNTQSENYNKVTG